MATWLYFPRMWCGLSRVQCCPFSTACKQRSKIYFAASIRAGRNDAKLYENLINYIKVHGQVLSESEQLGPNIDQEAKGMVQELTCVSWGIWVGLLRVGRVLPSMLSMVNVWHLRYKHKLP